MTDSKLLGRLLRRNISLGQIAAFAASSLVGLVIILTSIKFYTDITSTSSADGSTDYLVISHGVSGVGSITGGAEGFTVEEIERMKNQPWVKRLGIFTTAGFSVSAGIDLGDNSLSTALFLESLPDEFVETDPSQWQFTPGTTDIVPIGTSKDCLPQISDTMSGLLPINLTVAGNGLRHTFRARIVGFSNRLNTIAVPQSFMDWANSVYAGGETEMHPSRVIVETDNPGDPAIKAYLADNSYDLGGDKAFAGRASMIAGVLTAIIAGVGAVITLLSFGLLLLSVWLLLYKNRQTTELLMLEGFSASQIGGYYSRLIMAVNAALLVIAIAAMAAISGSWTGPLESAGISGSSPMKAIAAGATVSIIMTFGAIIAIRRTIDRSFSPRR